MATLSGFAIRFRKLSNDESTKADIAPVRRSKVLGVLFDIPDAELRELNRKEAGYDPVPVAVADEDGTVVEAWAYMAKKERGRSRKRPYGWYVDLVCKGGEFFNLPHYYVAAVRRRPQKKDADAARVRTAANALAADPTRPPRAP